MVLRFSNHNKAIKNSPHINSKIHMPNPYPIRGSSIRLTWVNVSAETLRLAVAYPDESTILSSMDNHRSRDSMYRREDESADSFFYEKPRYEKHIDDATIEAITQVYREYLIPDSSILDLMSSWISHLPEEISFSRVSGLGMNVAELTKNPRLDDFLVHDLNENPVAPYAPNSFDAVLIAVSVQYLINPVEVFKSIAKILKPGGKCIVSLSHRLFPSKAIRAFLVLPAKERCELVRSYFDYACDFRDVTVLDRSPINADPLWIVMAEVK